MKVLYVYGDDYAAMTFEDELHFDNPIDLTRLWEESVAQGMDSGYAFSEICVDEDNGIYCQALEFSAVDYRFIEWIKGDAEFLDYDESKTRNFYIVGE